MNRCQKCQAELPAEARFCNKCGSPQVFVESKPITSTSVPQDLTKKTLAEIAPTNNTPLASLHPNRSIQPTPKVSSGLEGEKAKPTTLPTSIKATLLPEASRSAPAPSSAQPAQTRPTLPPILPGQSAVSEPPKSTTQSTVAKPTQQLNKPKPSAQPAEIPSAAASAEKPKSQPLPETPRPTAPQPKQQVDAPTPIIPLDLPKSAGQPAVLKTQIWTEPSKPTTLLPETPQPEISAAKPSAATQPDTVRPAAQAKPDTAQSAIQPAPAKPDVAQPAAQPVPLQSLQALRPAIQAGTSANRSEPSKPGLIRPVGAAPSSKPATTSTPLAQPGKTQPTQGNNSLAIPPHLAALAAKKPTPLPPQRITPPPVPTEKQALDISEQVTRKDAAILAQQLWSAPNNSLSSTIQRGEIVRTSTLPPQRRRSDNVDELPIELEDLPVDDLPTGRVAAEPGRNSPSLAATSRVAEHWRNSWRDLQHAEAGPAVGVSRGQASVPTPLTAMQHSIARMRAIVLNKQQTQQSRNTNFGFWMTLFLMLCLIGGLGTYIISTFLTASSLGAAHIVHPGGIADPSLTVMGPQTSGVAIGQLLQLHGDHFDANDTITFYLDTTTQIMGPHGKPLSVQVNNAGRFDVSLPVDLNWSVGTHLIQAQDTRTHQTAYVNIEVTLKAKPETSSPNLALSTKLLSFSAIFGEGNPSSQRITFTNTSGQQLRWSVTATADNNLSWLVIDQDQTDGTMGIAEQDTLNVGIITAGLKPSLANPPKPYTGHILFTINGKELLTLPVQLIVQNPAVEMSFSPNPIITHFVPGGTCGTSTTLTLINLSNQPVIWTVKPDDNIASNIKFYNSAGKLITGVGFLDPSGTTKPDTGQRTDIIVLTLQCFHVKAGMQYHVSIYANGQPGSTDVIIQ